MKTSKKIHTSNNFTASRLMVSLVFIVVGPLLGASSCSDQEQNQQRTAVIGVDGGTLRSADGRLLLTFPPAAVNTDTAVTIVQRKHSGDGRATPLEAVYELRPDGTTFALPVIAQYRAGNIVSRNANEVTVPLTLLGIRSSGSEIIEILPNLVADFTAANNDMLVSGEVNHFSDLVVGGPDVERARSFGLDLVFDAPAELVAGTETTLRTRVKAPFEKVVSFFAGDFSETGPFQLLGDEVMSDSLGTTEEPASGFTQMATCITLEARESGTLSTSISFNLLEFINSTLTEDEANSVFSFLGGAEVGQLFANLFGNPVVDRQQFTLNGSRRADCLQTEITDPDEPAVAISIGVFDVVADGTKMTRPEAIHRLGNSFGNLTAGDGSTLLSFIGAQGSAVVDLASNQVINGGFNPESDPDTNGRFGQIGASQPDPGPGTAAALFEYTSPSGFSPFGGFLLNYDAENQEFGSFGQLISGSFLDATTAGNQPISDEIIACAGSIVPIRFDSSTGLYDQGDSFTAGRGCVSAVAATAGGPVLAASLTAGRFTDSRLFFLDRTETVTEVGVLGAGARRIRHQGDIWAATLFDDNAVRVGLWDGSNAPTIVGPAINVGRGPVGIDLRDAGNGNVEMVTAGFPDHNISILTVDSNGAAISNQLFAAPVDCLNPAHPLFIENADNSSEPFIVITCFGSDNYAVTQASALLPFDGDAP